MVPTLIEIGPFPIRSFGLMIALALICSSLRLAISFYRAGLDPAMAERYVMVGGVSGLIGARLWFIGEHFFEFQGALLQALFSSAGFTFYGGFIIAGIFVAIMAKRDGIAISKLCDAVGPCLALGYAIGRVGCQLSGDGDYGIATSSFWGMSYLTGVAPTLPGQLVFPTPLYESVIALGVLWVLTLVERRPASLSRPFQRFGLYLLLISLERFLIEWIRPNQKILVGLSEAQVIAIGFIFVSALLLCRPNKELTA